jgi:putative ABC transport system permease protein
MNVPTREVLQLHSEAFLNRCRFYLQRFRISIAGRALSLAWRNLAAHRLRSIASAGGLAVALLLMLMQIGFLSAAERKVTAFYDLFTFDLAVISSAYQFFYDAPHFDSVRLVQAKAHPDVAATLALSTSTGVWEELAENGKSSLLIFGVVPNTDFIAESSLRDAFQAIVHDDDVLVDSFSHDDYGSLDMGEKAKINDHRVVIRGKFELGLFFYADGAALTSRQNFLRLVRTDSRTINIGLLKLNGAPQLNRVVAELDRLLPDDVRVLTRGQLFDQEHNYFITIKPLGIILQTGAWFAFIVGAVIIYQVLATDILNRMRELAVLKAMGFSGFFIYGVSVAQALLVFLGGFVPALLATSVLFTLTNSTLHLGLELNFDLFVGVGAMSIGMVVIACSLTLHRIRHADPAELY